MGHTHLTHTVCATGEIMGLVALMLGLMAAWETIVVNGPAGRAAARKFPHRSPLKL